MWKVIVCCQGKSDNVHCAGLDERTGLLSHIWTSSAGENPTFAQKYSGDLIAVNELDSGSVLTRWHIGEAGLTHVSTCLGPGSGSCHAALWPDGRYVTVSNYNSGSFTTFSLNSGEIRFESEHRQNIIGGCTASHAHSCTFADGYVFGADLGADTVFTFTAGGGQLEFADCFRLKPGSGPRHMCVNNSAGKIYLITEGSNEVLVFSQVGGKLLAEQAIPVDNGVSGCAAAEIKLTGSGKWLLCSVRGGNHMAVLSVSNDGTLGAPNFYPLKLDGPRHFMITPDDSFVICAGQYSNDIVSCKLENGRISEPVSRIDCDRPVYLLEY